ncbi:sirohydrochlorin chelatase [Streptomyces sp. IBSBF 2435]|uniref:sirohydrochlorin chelatase n=1 Tax=Streptomyces sp. IBSBF 2435 TaxID=2903531 RepID=UPI002FDBDF25
MSQPCRVIAVCGHEAGFGAALRDTADPALSVVTAGRELFRCVIELRLLGEEVCVVPISLGRDPELVADTARTLRSLAAGERRGTVLAPPFGTSQHLTSWLRAAASGIPADSALLLTAPAGDPFDDAELYRVASLVRRYGNHALIEVAFTGGDPDPAEGVRRCRRLGAAAVTVLPASFVPPPAVPDDARTRVHGPLLSPAALARVIAERVADARGRWSEHGDDGVAAGLGAADGHGHHHTHPPGEGHGHRHGHGPPHPHPHPHAHAAGRVDRSTP